MGIQVLSKQSALITVGKYMKEERASKVKIVLETGAELAGREGLDVLTRMIHRHGVDYFELTCGKDKERVNVNYFSTSV